MGEMNGWLECGSEHTRRGMTRHEWHRIARGYVQERANLVPFPLLLLGLLLAVVLLSRLVLGLGHGENWGRDAKEKPIGGCVLAPAEAG